MCGIAGVFGRGVDSEALVRMTAALARRGPDDQGIWLDGEGGIGLGHRRLAIVDLSPAGHQPMTAPSGRFVIVFNGEIYNHGDLRAELIAEGHQVDWRGHSDTERLCSRRSIAGASRRRWSERTECSPSRCGTNNPGR